MMEKRLTTSINKISDMKKMQVSSTELERENEKMEERIATLKENLKLEKQTRAKLGGVRWRSSVEKKQAAAVPSRKKSHEGRKMTVLSDVPAANYSDHRLAAYAQDRNHNIIASTCGQCENLLAKVECVECQEIYCQSCFKKFHSKGALKQHRKVILDQDGSKKSAQQKQTKLMSSSPPVHASDERLDYNGSSPKAQDGSVDHRAVSVNSLAIGNYDEADSAKSFQKALIAWRENGNGQAAYVKRDSASYKTITTESACQSTDEEGGLLDRNPRSQSDIQVHFQSHSSLSYAQKLALKNYKRNPKNFLLAVQQDGVDSQLRASCQSVNCSAATPSSLSSRSSRDGKRLTQSNPNLDASWQASKDGRNSSQSNMDSRRSTTPNANRPTLSQIGKLNIVDVGFSPELGIDRAKSFDRSKCSTPVNGDHAAKNQSRNERVLVPRPPIGSCKAPSPSGPRFPLNRSRLHNSLPHRDVEKQNLPLTKTMIGAGDVHADGEMSISMLRRSGDQKKGTCSSSNNNNCNSSGSSGSSGSRNSNRCVQSSLGSLDETSFMYSGDRSSSMAPVKSKSVDEPCVASAPAVAGEPSDSYHGLTSFFTAGVGINTEDNNGNREGSLATDDAALDYAWSTTMPESSAWMPEKSRSIDSNINLSGSSHTDSRQKSLWPKLASAVLEADEFIVSSASFTGDSQDSRSTDEGASAASPLLRSPRVSWSDYDFLQAPPPSTKGDTLLDVHRASTITLFPLSPQPPDIWDNDSEGELFEDLTTRSCHQRNRQVAGVSFSSAKGLNEAGSKLDAEESSDLSIEDNDEGSGLTSRSDSGEEEDGLDAP